MCILYSPTLIFLKFWRKWTLVCAAQLLHVWLFKSSKQGNNLYIWSYIFGCQMRIINPRSQGYDIICLMHINWTETCNVWTDLCCVMTPWLDWSSFRQSASLQHFLCFLLSARAQKWTFTTFSRRTDDSFHGKMSALSERRQNVNTIYSFISHLIY